MADGSRVPHVVIVGAGFAGLEAARALRRAPVHVTVLDRSNHHLFQPLLYQVATASLSPADIASPIRHVLSRQTNTRVLLADVQGVDLPNRMLRLDGDELSYDYLIVATGSSHTYFGHPEWAEPAPGLKTLDDALVMRRRILLAFERAERENDEARRRMLLTFVIVGGGPTGVELAGALAEIARHSLHREFRTIEPEHAIITLIERGPTILPTFPESLRNAARASLRRLGVDIRENTAVIDVVPNLVQLDGQAIAAGTILWAAGVAASPLGSWLGVPLDRTGRVIVEPDLSIPGRPDVFVVGDLAAFTDQDGKVLPGLAPVAQQQGRHAAVNIVRLIAHQRTQPFRYRDYGNMATIGRGAAIADFGRVRLSGLIGWLAWLFVHIMRLVGFRNRIAVFFEWAWAYVSYQRSVRLITGGTLEP
ncbi:MAG: NAD(P)/FAD-dependent oxidoreductase [Acidobacteria bacterium]|jgi:NADH:ubiquinone reductase (H+-translocating)|nr:MAG: NAD(P)/FAD-dependent oxidoreductase [Acidobacteriota bacterium]